MYPIYLITTFLMLASIAAYPVFKVRVERVMQLQLVLVCVADIYASALALGCTCLFAAMTRPLTIPARTTAVWGLWTVAILSAMWTSGYTARTLAQVVELYYYLAIIVLAMSVAQCDNGHRRMLWGLTIGGLLLSVTFLAMPYLYADSWTAGLRGRNEGSFVLVFAGIIAPLTLSFWERGRTNWMLLAVSVLSLAATFTAESRASSLLGCAILGTVVFIRLFGLSILRFTMLGIVMAGLAMQTTAVQDGLDKLFDTERNFSNSERLSMIETCLDLFYEKPLTGWGWGTLEVLLSSRSHSLLDYPHPHNTYVHFAAELGIVGLIGLVILYGSVGVVALQNYASNRAGETVFVALSGTALVMQGFVEDYFYGGSRGVIAAIILGIAFSYSIPSKKTVGHHAARVRMPRQLLHNQLSTTNGVTQQKRTQT